MELGLNLNIEATVGLGLLSKYCTGENVWLGFNLNIAVTTGLEFHVNTMENFELGLMSSEFWGKRERVLRLKTCANMESGLKGTVRRKPRWVKIGINR